MSSLIYLLIILLPWETRWIINPIIANGFDLEYDNISLYATDILILLGTLFYLRRNVLEKIKISWQTLLWILLIAITITVSADKILALYYWFRIFIITILVLLIYYSKASKTKIAIAFVVSATIESILAIVQFMFQSTYFNKWFGLAYHDITIAGNSVVATVSDKLLRPYGTLPHPNILGGFLAVAAIIALWLIWQHKSISNNIHNDKIPLADHQLPTNYWFLLACYYTILLALFLTFSRSAWLAFIVALCVWFYLCPTFRKQFNNDWWKKYVIWSSLIFISILSIIFIDFILARSLISNNILENTSLMERGRYIKGAINILLTHPFFGVGIGRYTNAVQSLYPNHPAWSYQPVHNIYLLILVELGIVGVSAFIALLYYTLKKKRILLLQTSKNSMFFLLISALLVIGLFDHYLWTLHFGLLLTGFVIGFGLLQEESKNIKNC